MNQRITTPTSGKRTDTTYNKFCNLTIGPKKARTSKEKCLSCCSTWFRSPIIKYGSLGMITGVFLTFIFIYLFYLKDNHNEVCELTNKDNEMLNNCTKDLEKVPDDQLLRSFRECFTIIKANLSDSGINKGNGIIEGLEIFANKTKS
ncbi:MAG: hypothetical protein ACK5Z5_10125 [Neisseriaceae bacterium]